MKHRCRQHLVTSIVNNPMRTRAVLVTLVLIFVFNSCTALEEAQQRRAKRILEKRDAASLMLRPSKATIAIRPDALLGESDHYTLKFAEDLQRHEEFDEIAEREVFTRSALGYMESLYDAMNRLFGFKPET